MDDGYRNTNQVSDDYRYQDGSYEAPNDGYYRGGEEPAQEEDAQSDVTEGHDEDDEVYEGEYQGIPHPDDIKEKQKKRGPAMDDDYRDRADLMAERMEDEEQLAHQYENIIEECGHGRFQWTLFFVLGLALMADGVEVFVVGFVLPSAEKDMCLSSSNKGMLGKCHWQTALLNAVKSSWEHFSSDQLISGSSKDFLCCMSCIFMPGWIWLRRGSHEQQNCTRMCSGPSEQSTGPQGKTPRGVQG